MNKYTFATILALLLLVIILPVYTYLEPLRMEKAQAMLRGEFVSDAAVLYVQNCAVCHGASGEGIGAMPALNDDGLREADYDFLYKTIARGRYDTAMAGWHVAEGGIFNEYQIDELIALIRYVDWNLVGEMAAAEGLIPPTLPVPIVEASFLEEVLRLDPEGVIWAEGVQLFANNCTVCHGVNGEGSDLGAPLNTADIRARETAVLIRTITEGVPGTAMVAWDNALESSEIEAIVAFLQHWDLIQEHGLALTPPQPIQIDLDNPDELLALGERIFASTCSACHGENGSGGTGPALNSQQILSNRSNEQIVNTIINGGHRPNSTMPAFGDRLTSVELQALVGYIRAWEPTAPIVENPRGTAQGGGPPWLRATPDAENPVAPQSGGQGNGYRGGANPDFQGGGQGQGGPAWRQNNDDPVSEPANSNTEPSDDQSMILHFLGEVITVNANRLTFRSSEGVLLDAMLGPPWFWTESGIPLNPGDTIEMEGFESTDHLELNWIANLSSGQRMDLRTPDGLPVWGNDSP